MRRERQATERHTQTGWWSPCPCSHRQYSPEYSGRLRVPNPSVPVPAPHQLPEEGSPAQMNQGGALTFHTGGGTVFIFLEAAPCGAQGPALCGRAVNSSSISEWEQAERDTISNQDGREWKCKATEFPKRSRELYSPCNMGEGPSHHMI